jgi:hypothetical protein
VRGGGGGARRRPAPCIPSPPARRGGGAKSADCPAGSRPRVHLYTSATLPTAAAAAATNAGQDLQLDVSPDDVLALMPEVPDLCLDGAFSA